MQMRPSAMLASLLLAHSAWFVWQIGTRSPMIDFFTFWSVPHTNLTNSLPNIYSPENQHTMGSRLLAEAQMPGASETQRRATEATMQLYGGRVDATGSPLLYTLVGLLSSNDYETDRKRFVLVSVICLGAAVMVLCHLLRFEVVSIILVLAFMADFSPVISDLRVGNLNEIQLFAITLFILFTCRSQPVLAGVAIGTATMLKPTTLIIFALSSILCIADRDFGRLLRMLVGWIVAAALSVAVSGMYLGSPTMWIDFLKSLPTTLGGGAYPSENGNFSLSTLLFGGTGPAAMALLITLLLAFSWMVFATRRSALAWESTIQDAFSVAGFGSAIMLLSSPLAWLHYYVLLIPLSLYVMPRISATKEPPRSDGVMTGLVPFVPLLMFSALTESMMRGNAVGVAVVVNSATILTVALAFFKIQRERASVGAARLPAASGRRQSRKSSVHAGT